MKKLLCSLLLIVMVIPFSSCGADKHVYEVVYMYNSQENIKAYLNVDPFSLEAGESCFATLTIYNGEEIYQAPCVVFATREPSGTTTYAFKDMNYHEDITVYYEGAWYTRDAK